MVVRDVRAALVGRGRALMPIPIRRLAASKRPLDERVAEFFAYIARPGWAYSIDEVVAAMNESDPDTATVALLLMDDDVQRERARAPYRAALDRLATTSCVCRIDAHGFTYYTRPESYSNGALAVLDDMPMRGQWHAEDGDRRVASRDARIQAELLGTGDAVMLAFEEREVVGHTRATSLVLSLDQARAFGRELLALADGRRP